MPKCNITIHTPDKTQSFSLRKGLGLQALSPQESPLEYDCRKADCGICIFKILKGAAKISEPTPAERDFLDAMRADKNERLACQCRVFGDIEILIEFV